MVDTGGYLGKEKIPNSLIFRVRDFAEKLPNQGSNLDFTDPESVVLPITPLGTEIGCKNTLFLNAAIKKRNFFRNFFAYAPLSGIRNSISILVES